jgi:hypothetical protein
MAKEPTYPDAPDKWPDKDGSPWPGGPEGGRLPPKEPTDERDAPLW